MDNNFQSMNDSMVALMGHRRVFLFCAKLLQTTTKIQNTYILGIKQNLGPDGSWGGLLLLLVFVMSVVDDFKRHSNCFRTMLCVR